jgi:RimJ/RimL family protein N-acetyltransferase
VITLAPLARSEFDRVAHIAVAEHQHKFAGTVREAFEADEAGVDFHGMFRDGRAVGFFKIDRAYATKYDFCAPGDIGLRAFIVDLSLQGSGIGTAAVAALPVYLPRHYPKAGAVVLTVNFVNPAAYHAYIKGGFEDTGKTYPHGDAGPQNVLRMAL